MTRQLALAPLLVLGLACGDDTSATGSGGGATSSATATTAATTGSSSTDSGGGPSTAATTSGGDGGAGTGGAGTGGEGEGGTSPAILACKDWAEAYNTANDLLGCGEPIDPDVCDNLPYEECEDEWTALWACYAEQTVATECECQADDGGGTGGGGTGGTGGGSGSGEEVVACELDPCDEASEALSECDAGGGGGSAFQ
jgi:hypothetical protein